MIRQNRGGRGTAARARKRYRSREKEGSSHGIGNRITFRLKIATKSCSPRTRTGATLVKIQPIVPNALSALLCAVLALPAFAQTFSSTPLANPAGPGSLQPNWSVAPDGGAVFSWIEPSQGGPFPRGTRAGQGGSWTPP